MITPQDIMDQLAELVRDKFPGELVYMDRVPTGFERPSNLITLGKYTGNAGYGASIVELTPVITMTTFVAADERHHSHLRELNQRLMTMTGILMPGYIKVGDRAPKVQSLELEGGYDYATLAASFFYTLDRSDFIAQDQTPVAGHLTLNFTNEDRR